MSSAKALSERAGFTKSLFVEYEALRGKTPNDDGDDVFWDMVVISAGAESQKSWYEEQARTNSDFNCHNLKQNVKYNLQ